MRNIFIALFIILNMTGRAQETGMHIEHDATWQQILDKAKKENKFIFLDAYASWCGPCKWMAKEVFPKKEVGDAINPHYISAKIDMEKGEGLELAKKYNVRNYPTYLFFDPNGELVHRSLGSMPAKDFISLCTNTLNPDKQFVSLKKKYDLGVRDTAFLRNYAQNANDAQDSTAQVALKDFLGAVHYELSPANIALIAYMTNSIQDTGYAIITDHKDLFFGLLGKDEINSKLEELVWIEAKRAGKKGTDKEAFKRVIQQYIPEKTDLLCAEYELSLYKRSGNWSAYLPKAETFANVFCQNDWERLNDIANNFLENYSTRAALQTALKISLRSVEVKQNYINLLTTAQIYQKVKDKVNAAKYADKAFQLTTPDTDERTEVEQFIKTLK